MQLHNTTLHTHYTTHYTTQHYTTHTPLLIAMGWCVCDTLRYRKAKLAVQNTAIAAQQPALGYTTQGLQFCVG